MRYAPAMLGLLLAGCSLVSLPNQSHPVCSWSSRPPSNASTLCTQTFQTLRALASADETGAGATIHRLVAAPAVANRIIAYGRQQRQNGLKWMHVAPSITVGAVTGGRIGAGFTIVGKNRFGTISAPQSLYLRIRRGRAIVVGDQIDQEW
jgi:hypothetical protein